LPKKYENKYPFGLKKNLILSQFQKSKEKFKLYKENLIGKNVIKGRNFNSFCQLKNCNWINKRTEKVSKCKNYFKKPVGCEWKEIYDKADHFLGPLDFGLSLG